MDVIVHFIHRDKFTAGYIEFMKLSMPEYEHHFFTAVSGFPLNIYNYDNIHYYNHFLDILDVLSRGANIRLLRKCKKIIISGVYIFITMKVFILLSGLISKTYLHFWGGDFYGYRSINYSIKHPFVSLKVSLKKFIQHCLIKKCAGTISLIETDIEKLCEIFPNSTKHFTAPMPGSPLRKINFEPIRQIHERGSIVRILVGNSAFPENKHSGVFHAIEHLKDEDIEIICPLSYGNLEYREKVIDEGSNIFGSKFKPITEFISKEEYIKFLASCDVGVFNNNRQQGMGNIFLLLRLGKKVYIREDTSMWHHYKKNMKYFVYPVSELKEISLEDFVRFSSEQAYNNIKIADEYALGNQAIEQWRKVLED